VIVLVLVKVKKVLVDVGNIHVKPISITYMLQRLIMNYRTSLSLLYSIFNLSIRVGTATGLQIKIRTLYPYYVFTLLISKNVSNV